LSQLSPICFHGHEQTEQLDELIASVVLDIVGLDSEHPASQRGSSDIGRIACRRTAGIRQGETDWFEDK
jgi:hypothetical protein